MIRESNKLDNRIDETLTFHILTVGELLQGKTIDAPPTPDIRTFNKAARVKKRPIVSKRICFE